MKNFTSFIMLLIIYLGYAQAPNGYYDGTDGLKKEALKTKLSSIISNGHKDNGYKNLYEGYKSTDSDFFYENDGSVLDMYSENPTGVDTYFYNHGQKQCGNYKQEGDCYNREHIVPQSLFNKKSPMRNDIHFVVPSDGKVNGMRSNYPFGIVKSASFTSHNGSKVGSNSTDGFNGMVFEPIDEFKGDIARMIFYFVTRYESELPNFESGGILDKKSYPGITKWQLDVLLSWHKQDPVSQREISRNNAAYNYQGNRNPYIDNPNWVEEIWGDYKQSTPTDNIAPSIPTGLKITNITESSISISWTESTDNVGVVGYDIYVDGTLNTSVNSTNHTIYNLSPNTSYTFSIRAKDKAGNLSEYSENLIGKTLSIEDLNFCVVEDFRFIPAKGSSYGDVTWTNNGITWTATDARTDQKINDKAILIRNGSLTSSKIKNGIGSLAITTKLPFKDKSGYITLTINGKDVGVIPYSSDIETTIIHNINIEEDAIIVLKNDTKNRIAIDDISWTCYSTKPQTEDAPNYKNVVANKFLVTPNPVTNGELYVHGLNNNKTYIADIYTIQGHLIKRVYNVSNNSMINIKNLSSGVYIIKINSKTAKFIVK